MGVREAINEHRVAATLVLAALIIGALVWITMQAKGPGPNLARQAYYSDDDGLTYFTDDIMKVTPFDHNGKQAVKAHVYACKGAPPTVHYLERFNEAGFKAATQSLKDSGGKDITLPEMMVATEYKRPGDKTWATNPPGPKPCPDGSQADWITP